VSPQDSVAERVARLRRLRSGDDTGRIPAAEPLLGDHPPDCRAYLASFAQARLWFLQKLEPELTAYNLSALWRLSGDLDVPALEHALRSLTERHCTLRSSFRLHDGEVRQIIHPTAPFSLRVEQLGDRDEGAVLSEMVARELAMPFDLDEGMLIRACLLRIATDEHLILLAYHHIAADGWSASVIARDLAELYNAHHGSRKPQLPELPAQYHDYAAWQLRGLSGPRAEGMRDYWREQLDGIEPLDLPSDRPRSVTTSHPGDTVTLEVDAELLAPFAELCRAEGATLHMGLLSLVALILHRYSRQTDLAVGVPIWGRNRSDVEELVGLFANTVPVRVRFEPDQTFRQLLRHVVQTSVEAYDNQDLPFEQIVDAVQPDRDTSRNPLFQVLTQLDELPVPTLDALDGLTAVAVPATTDAARFDLEFTARRAPEGSLRVTINFAADLFSAAQVERLGTHLQALLAAVLAEPDARASSLDMLPDSELKQIERWQCGPGMANNETFCVHEIFARQVVRDPEAHAVVFDGRRLSYAELDKRANQLAHRLVELGVRRDSIVVISLERSVELVVALLATLKAGGSYLPVDPAWPAARKRLILAELGPRPVIVADRAALPVGVEDGEHWVDPGDTALSTYPTETPDSSAHNSRQLAYVNFTSGSTGGPKGVMVEHRGIGRLLDPRVPWRIGPGDRMLHLAPASFDLTTLEIWLPLLSGATLVVAPPGLPTLDDLADLIRTERISTLWLTAGLFHAMAAAKPEALSGVRRLLAGGEAVERGAAQAVLDLMPADHLLVNGYGPTEATTFASYHAMRGGSVLPPRSSVPIGRPLPATTLQVLDPSGRPCPIGVPGELHIGGIGLARGYLNNDDFSAEKFVTDPRRPDDVLYRSGDLCAWNPDGTLAFRGRADQQVKISGVRVEPGEVESALREHPAVARALVTMRDDASAHALLVAYWVPRPGEDASVGQLRGFLAERLPESMIPAAFVSATELPLTATGKLDRKALPMPVFGNGDSAGLRTGVQEELAGIWARTLGHNDFGITDNFFMVGGNSLATIRLQDQLTDQFMCNLPLSLIFKLPTIAQQAEWLTRSTTSDVGTLTGAGVAGENLVTLQPHGDRPALYALHGWGGGVASYVHLAREFAPRRPVFGLLASEVEIDSALSSSSLADIADRYAAQIMSRHPDGAMIHLLGFSAGGWYAHAVADALLRRGARIGLLAVLDAGDAADVHRRIRLVVLILRIVFRLRFHLVGVIAAPDGEGRIDYTRRRFTALKGRVRDLLHRYRVDECSLRQAATGGGDPSNPESDVHDVLLRGYRPPRLPVAVDLFGVPSRLGFLRPLWRFYARAGVRTHPMFDEHTDFLRPESAGALAAALESALEKIEGMAASEARFTPDRPNRD